jgi:hypothetical protein
MKLTRLAYSKLIRSDLEWLKRQPNTLENRHIQIILAKAVEDEYGICQRCQGSGSVDIAHGMGDCPDCVELSDDYCCYDCQNLE